MNTYQRRILQIGFLMAILLGVKLPLHAQVGANSQTIDDVASLQPPGTTVTIPVLSNDLPAGPWIASTVRIVDPNDLATLLTKYVEPDQGIWTVNQADGSISFTPCTGSGTPDSQCTTALNTLEPYPIDYVVEDATQALSNPAIVTIGYEEQPLSASLAYFSSSRTANGRTEFVWVMGVENQTAGFNLLVETDGEQTQINEQFIASLVVDSFEPQLYSYDAQVDGNLFYLHEISINGTVNVNGPFGLGESFGSNPFQEENVIQVFLPLVSSPSQ